MHRHCTVVLSALSSVVLSALSFCLPTDNFPERRTNYDGNISHVWFLLILLFRFKFKSLKIFFIVCALKIKMLNNYT